MFITDPLKDPSHRLLNSVTTIKDKSHAGLLELDSEGNLVFSGQHRFLENHAPQNGKYKTVKKIST